MPETTITGVQPGQTDYDYLVFIGRFQPFHFGHKRVIDQALMQSKKVIVLIGSSNEPRTLHNPFSFQERRDMISNSFQDYHFVNKLIIEPLEDTGENDQQWVANVQRIVTDRILLDLPGNAPGQTLHGMGEKKIGLIGCAKDSTSYYLKLFPMWGNEAVQFLDPINATDIREEYFPNKISWVSELGDTPDQTPTATWEFLKDFERTEDFTNLWGEYTHQKWYDKQWADAPYPPIFVTTDAVIIQSGHVLLVERAAYPGKGLIALPGGFLKKTERILDGMIRELREETKIRVPDPVLRGSIKDIRVFDAPNRSSRGRTITHAFMIKLEDRTELPEIKGSDDAKRAFWLPLGELDRSVMFEDHYHVIQSMLNV